MQISFAVASSLALLVASGHVTNAQSLTRQLQNFPSTNNQGPFRPGPMAPNGPQGQPQPMFGGFPAQGNGLGQGAAPMNGQVPIGQVPNTEDTATGARETDETAPSDAVAEAETGAPASATNDASVPTTPVVAPPAGDIAPGQPTIMVIVPDFLAVGSGWSSYSGEVGETKTPATEKPKEEEAPKTSAAAKESVALRQLAFVAACTAMLGFTGVAN